jgi:hypothetical protein
MRSPSLYLCFWELLVPSTNFRMPKPIFMKLGMHIITPQPISPSCFINHFHQYVCLCVYLPIVTRQRLGVQVPVAKNIHNNIRILDSPFSVHSVSYQRTFFVFVYLPIVDRKWLGKHVPAATKN